MIGVIVRKLSCWKYNSEIFELIFYIRVDDYFISDCDIKSICFKL